MSVVGFDVGNDTCVIAAVKQRGIDVLLNDESKRETPSAVSFAEKQRFLGSTASAAAINPRSTVHHLKPLLGCRFVDAAATVLPRLPFSTSEAPDGGILVHLRYLNEDRPFTPVQILAMLFAHLKTVAEKNLETLVSDCVIGIPSYFTNIQRRCYLDAAAIAGLRPLRLMHDTAATALGYGIYKNETGSTMNVVFVDVGHCGTQVSVVSFEASQMRVLSHAFDANLGGSNFDEVLFNYFSEKFKEQYKIDVASNIRASIRLRVACEKLKKVLSANAEAPLTIECLMDEKDVKGFIKREEFETLSLELLERILIPCNKALADSGLGVERIHSVELVGSGSRIPAIMRALTDFFRREPRRTLNASECVARGCALQCAMLSPIFRVREYEVQDTFPFSVGLVLDEGPNSTLSNNILFRKGQPIPSVKMLTFQRTNSFDLEVVYTGELPLGVAPTIGRFKVGPFQVSQNGKPKVKVKVRLNLHGIVSVDSATLIEDDMNYQLPRDTNRPYLENTEPEDATGAQSDTRADTMRNGTFEQYESDDKIRKGKTSKRHEIPVTEMTHGGMTKAQLLEAQEQERQLARQDKLMEQTKDRKNALEAYVYEIRNKLFERYRSFASESEREGISVTLQQTEDWLYEDGDDETESVYSSKLEELKKLVNPIENRFKDEEARAQATRDLLKCIVDHRMAVQSHTAYERDTVISECNKAEQWLRGKTQQQDLLPKNADPLLWSYEIKKRAEGLSRACRNIMKHKNSQSRTEGPRGSSDHSNPTDCMDTE